MHFVQAAAAAVAVNRIAVPIRRNALGVTVERIALRQTGAESNYVQLVVLAEFKVETTNE